MKAELHGAFAWDCDNCGSENFVRAIEGDVDEAAFVNNEDQIIGYLSAIPYKMNGEDGDIESEADFLQQIVLLAPIIVRCRSCGKEYNTELPEYE